VGFLASQIVEEEEGRFLALAFVVEYLSSVQTAVMVAQEYQGSQGV
jgi:hypothetical protein